LNGRPLAGSDGRRRAGEGRGWTARWRSGGCAPGARPRTSRRRALADALRGADGYRAAGAYLAEEEADRALEVTRWRRRGDRAVALGRAPAAWPARLDELSAGASPVR
jgi:hypothetical protein